ncbi:hypothetical protein L915_00007, partial [Phytophthora nicotianae]
RRRCPFDSASDSPSPPISTLFAKAANDCFLRLAGPKIVTGAQY